MLAFSLIYIKVYTCYNYKRRCDMKKFIKCLLILGIIALGVFLYFTFKNNKLKANIEEIKKGWYVEITYQTPINVRLEPNENAKAVGKVNKGEIYRALDVDTKSSDIYFWYKIDYNGEEGWIASVRKNPWVEDHNNPIDILTPKITFAEDEVNFRSINDINYKHLTITEDSTDYTITHTVYHEVVKERNIDQYWIKYTITDKSGKSSSKTQKIIFEIAPEESDVVDFSEYKR